MASWHDIEKELRQAAPTPAPRPATAFWAEFRRRAAEPSDGADFELVQSPWAEFHLLRWAAVLLVVFGLIGGGLLLSLPESGSGVSEFAPGPRVHQAAVLNSEVLSVQVSAVNSGVIVVEDEQQRGTMIWVAGLESP